MNKVQTSRRGPGSGGPSRSGRSGRGDSRRDELLAIGRRLFASEPFDALSIDRLAAEAGVAKGLLYYYFGSKRGYYVAVVEDAAAELSRAARPDPAHPPAERLRRTIDAWVAYADRYPAALRTFSGSGIGADEEVRAVHDRERAALLALVAAETVGDPPPPAARIALEGWFSFVEGATLDWLEHRDLGTDELGELLASALAGALGAAVAVDRGIALDLTAVTG